MISSGHTELHHHVCVPIQGICDNGFAPGFVINGHWTLWPAPGNRNYSIIYSQVSETYSFCFSNVTEDITLTEYCHQRHIAGCSICSDGSESNEIILQSFSDIQLASKSNSIH